ncbi:hypothetical protein SPD48_16985 [Pseudogracilibacillus sp. SE30717A]|uniref:hypothetical protein n=1 Tax=Pseudogracilibacillus sp. SE30717A TaxID=3098293 RepID=UPI00300E692A
MIKLRIWRILQKKEVLGNTIRCLTEELNQDNADYKLLKVKFQIRLNPLTNNENEDLSEKQLWHKKEVEKATQTFINWQKEIMNGFVFDLHNGLITSSI